MGGWVPRVVVLVSAVAMGCVPIWAQTLQECVDEALLSNPSAAAAEARVRAAAGAVTQARAAYLPQVSVAGGYTHTDNAPQAFMMALNQGQLDMSDPAFDPNDPDDTGNLRLSVGARYPLFDGGQRGAGLDMAVAGSDMAKAQLVAVRNALVYHVTRGYYGVLQAQALVGVRQASVDSIAESLRVARERVAAGSAVRTDVLNLDVKLAEAQEDLIRAQNGHALAIAALNTAMGRARVPDAGLDVPELLPQDVVTGVHTGVAARAELAAARAGVRQREGGVRAARSAWWPTVSAFGSMDADSERLDTFHDSYVVGVAATWQLYTGGTRRGAGRQAHALREAAQWELEATRKRLTLDLTQARLGLREARQRRDVTARSVRHAEEALRITRGRYEQGTADITELLTAQVGLTAIQSRAVSARYDAMIAEANVARARGVLWTEEVEDAASE